MEFTLFKKQRKPYGYWTYRRLRAAPLKYRNKLEFARKNSTAYRVALDKQMIDIVAGDLPENVILWNFEKVQKEALQYTSRTAFNNHSRGAYAFANSTGILNQVCKHMKSRYTKWTFETCLEEARKHKQCTDWYDAHGGSCKCAYRKGWIAEIKKIVWGRE